MYLNTEYSVEDIATNLHVDVNTAEIALRALKKSEILCRTFEGRYKRMAKERGAT